MKFLVLLLLSSLFALPTYAKTYGELILPEITTNSCFELSGRFSPEVTIAVITLKLGKDTIKHYQQPLTKDADGEGTFSDFICLKQGFGRYSFDLQLSVKSPVKGGYFYEPTQTYGIENRDYRPFTQFNRPSKKIQVDAPEIRLTADAIIEGVKTTKDRVRAIHDWVAQTVAYDTDGYFAWVEGNQERSFQNKKLDALSVWQEKVAVCNGYARLTVALLRAIGVQARVVTGVANGEAIEWTADKLVPGGAYAHAWVEYDLYGVGEWQSMDPTWDAGSVNFQTKKFIRDFKHTYFDVDENEFKKTHVKLEVSDE